MPESKQKIVSGIRPTGELHLGNYLGAMRDFIALQEQDYQCFFFVADLHALTTAATEHADVNAQSVEVLRLYLACGLNPEQCVLYRQSDIPQLPYLALLLGMIAPVGELHRCTTYKEQVQAMQDSNRMVSLGLLTYPVLMAADVLFCNADLVPVGEDQLQHLEIVREVARRYNSHIARSHTFTEPMPYQTHSLRVPGLRGQGKMSKSEGSADNAVLLLDSPAEVTRKVKSALTDSGDGDEMSAPVKNLFQLVELCCSSQTHTEYRQLYERGERRFYGTLKQQLAADMVAMLAPIQERYHRPECSADRVRQLLYENAERVRTLAQRTLTAVQADFRVNSQGQGSF